MSSLNGKRLLITGIATEESIAFETAKRSLELGAKLVLSAYPRQLDQVTDLALTLDSSIPVVGLDLTDQSQVSEIASQVGQLDGALHAVAYAPGSALNGAMADADPAGIELAFRTSAWSFTALASILQASASPGGASLVGLDFDADDRAWHTYNWMGVCKAALRSSSRYLARDLGPSRIRVNLVAAGPLRTRAASGIPGFNLLEDAWATTAPLGWDLNDPGPTADVVCFLLSDAARAITGEVIHVDGGFHAMATSAPAG